MIIDILLLVFIAYGLYTGYKKEPFKSLFKFFPYMIGGLITVYLSPVLYDKIAESWGKDSVILFLIVVIICFLIGTSFIKYLVVTVTSFAKKAGIKKPEKSINALTLSFIMAIVFSGLVTFFDKSDLIPERTKDSSISLKVLESLPHKLKASVLRMKPGFKNFYNKSNELIEDKNDSK